MKMNKVAKMAADKNGMKKRIGALTEELNKEKNAKRRAQLMLERSVFANMVMQKDTAN